MRKTALIIALIIIIISFSAENVYSRQESPPSIFLVVDEIEQTAPDIADIAKEIEISVQKTTKLEQKARNRSFFMRIFFGGDWETARELEAEAEENIERIKQMKNLVEQCEQCSNEIKEGIGRWINTVEKEQKRIHAFAVVEGKTRGLFGWFKR